MTSRAQAVADAGHVLARAYAEMAERSPREVAEAAYVPGGPGVEQIERAVRERRGLPPLAA